jgi:hypothetical protein
MRVGFGRALLFVAAVGMVSAASAADEKKKDTKDPNRIICEKQEALGSRLQAKRVCMTAEQWAQKRREDRQMVDRAQTAIRGPDGS